MACTPSGEGLGCFRAWANYNVSACPQEAATVCLTGLHSPPAPPPAAPPLESSGGFAYGAILSVCCDIVIAIGLGLQKKGHMRTMAQPEDERGPVFRQPVWVAGLACMIGGEIGNLLAYGDPETPTAVVTSVGCIGVVANLFISTVFLGEEKRLRDVLGATFVVIGVIIVTVFAPNNPQPLTGEQLNAYLVEWGAIAIYIVYGSGIVYLYFAVQRIGHTHVVWYILLSALIGGFTVMSSKPVATFLMLSVEGLATGHFDDQLDMSIDSQAACDASDGFGIGTEWRAVSGSDAARLNSTHGCFNEGLGQLDQPTFWVAIVILIVTAISQVKYLNDALALFNNSEVIPVHYTLFTLSSMTGSIIMYQEYQVRKVDGCTQWWTLHLFFDGIACTFLGVYFITTKRVVIDPDNPESVSEGLLQMKTDSSLAAINEEGGALDGVHLVVPPQPPPPDHTPSYCGPDGTPRTPNPGTAASAASTPWSDATSASATESPPAAASPQLSGSAMMGLSRQATRDIIMGERIGSGSGATGGERGGAGASSAAVAVAVDGGGGAATRASRVLSRVSFASHAEEPGDGPPGRRSVALFPRGLDARPSHRSSRTSNVVSYLGALSGGQMATFMYDPEDKRVRDAEAAKRAVARASAAEAAQDSYVPVAITFGIGRQSLRSRSSSAVTDGHGCDGMRSRTQSMPQQSGASTLSEAPAPAAAFAALPRLDEVSHRSQEQAGAKA